MSARPAALAVSGSPDLSIPLVLRNVMVLSGDTGPWAAVRGSSLRKGKQHRMKWDVPRKWISWASAM